MVYETAIQTQNSDPHLTGTFVHSVQSKKHEHFAKEYLILLLKMILKITYHHVNSRLYLICIILIHFYSSCSFIDSFLTLNLEKQSIHLVWGEGNITQNTLSFDVDYKISWRPKNPVMIIQGLSSFPQAGVVTHCFNVITSRYFLQQHSFCFMRTPVKHPFEHNTLSVNTI